MSISAESFGKTKDGKDVLLFTLSDNDGSNIKITNYGCAITEINVKDKNGKLVDVTLGYDDVQGYENSGTYFGVICGRCSNRIAQGKFSLNGTDYQLFINDGPNHLHGGKEGFCFKLWNAEVENDEKLIFTYHSSDMEEGYPGNLDVAVIFAFIDHKISIECSYTSDKITIANVINHSYFNLSGHDSGTVYDQLLMIDADQYCEDDENVMPYKEPVSVNGTPFDFTQKHAIGERIAVNHPQIKNGRGYDHNWVLRKKTSEFKLAAEANSLMSGICLRVYTDLPGIQFYSGNMIGNVKGKGGIVYSKGTGFCLKLRCFQMQ